jgi:hypothetical protein
MHRKVAAALLAALALGVVGCGGSEETLTRAQLSKRIEVACKHGKRVQEDQMRASRRSSSANGAAQFLAAAVASQEAVMERIDDLHATDAVQDELDAFKEGIQGRIDLFERIKSAGDAAAIQRAIGAAAAEGERVTERLKAAATKLGVEECV